MIGGPGYCLGEYDAGYFRHDQVYIAGLYRYNLTDRFALRFNAGFSKIDIQQMPLLPVEEVSYPTDIHCRVRDFSKVMEFDFRSFMVAKVKESLGWSLYILAGEFFRRWRRREYFYPFGNGYKIQFISLIFLRYWMDYPQIVY